MAKLYDKPITAISMGNHAVVLPQALTASKGVWGKFRKASSLEPKGRLQRKHWDSREERFSILCHELQLKLIHRRRKVESVQSFLNTSPFSVGSSLRKRKAEFHSRSSLVSTRNEDWSLGEFFFLSINQASLASETRVNNFSDIQLCLKAIKIQKVKMPHWLSTVIAGRILHILALPVWS